MVGKTKNHTKADKRRFADLQEVGCIACRLEGIHGEPCDIHHITSCGRRIGHQHTIGLCPYHHRGINTSGFLSDDQLYALKGPSLAKSKREFVAKYGTEGQLLNMVNDLLGRLAA